jgi:hypothetical protein
LLSTSEEKNNKKLFDEIKQKVSKETLFTFPDFEKEFHVYTDASNKQLRAVIMQEGNELHLDECY